MLLRPWVVVVVVVILRIAVHHCTFHVIVDAVEAPPPAPEKIAVIAVQQHAGAVVTEWQKSNEDPTSRYSTSSSSLSESLEKHPTAATSLPRIQQQQQDNRAESLFVSLMAASAGWGDVRAHRQYGCFVNMCTGNTIRGTLALVERQNRQKTILPWTIVAGYCGGVGLARQVRNGLTVNQEKDKNKDWSPADQQIKSNDSSSKISNTCLKIIPIIVLLFTLTDLILSVINDGSATASWFWHTLSTLPQAIAYGLIHETASQATGGTVLFAVTGHWASIARLSTDQTCGPSQHTTANNKELPERRLLTRHSRIVASFVGGIVAAVLCLDYWAPLLPEKLVERTHSVSYTITGIAYASLLYWYGNRSNCT